MKQKFPKLATLNPQKGERGVLVKDYHGDYAVLVGRWLVLRKSNKETSPSEFPETAKLPEQYPSTRYTRA